MFRAIPLCLIAGASLPSAGIQPSRFDLLIIRGIVVDGSGAARRRADVGDQGRPHRRHRHAPAGDARETIDATGLVVAPGFIDVHTHADDIAEHPRAENFVRMGVTSIVAGNCGGSALDVGEALTTIRQTRRRRSTSPRSSATTRCAAR